MNKFKEQVFNKLISILDEKISLAKFAIESAKESRNNDTKSSAGDKFETGREMIQIEIDKSEAQLSKALKLKTELLKINLNKKHSKIEFGSLAITNQGKYFFSIGIGKLDINNDTCFAISLASPIGKLLYNKTIGDIVKFNNRDFIINDII